MTPYNSFMKKFIVFSLSFFCLKNSFAQTAEDSVKQIVNQMFVAMKRSDVALFKASFTDSAFLQTIATDRNTGRMKIKNEDIKAFAQTVGELPKDSADERITFDVVRIDGDLASVWTPYQFYYNGRFSHCGVNSFQVVRLNGVWKIHYVIDTRRKDNCIK
jgi:hypothetical protein